jgi:glutamate:Na+ symporter, ESS family
MTVASGFWAVLFLALLLVVSRVIRQTTTVFRRIFLPSSVIAGVLGLLLGPQVLGLAVPALPDGFFPEEIQAVWRALPGLLINVVFGALLLGKAIPGLREIWRTAGPQVVVGQTIAWGQYVVGLGLAMLVLGPVFGLPAVAGALIEIGFEGGHGTAAGMRGAFEAVGFEEGFDLAVAMATIGLVGGVLVGTALINWGARRGYIEVPEGVDSLADVALYQPPATETERRAEREELTELRRDKEREARATDPLSLHLGIVAIAIGIGWLLREALLLFERATWGRPVPGEEPLLIVAHVPLFPLAMIGGVLVQLAIDRLGLGDRVSRRLMNRISGASLDLIIVGAIATLSLQALGENLIPILLLATLGTLRSLTLVGIQPPRLVPPHWLVRATRDLGSSPCPVARVRHVPSEN